MKLTLNLLAVAVFAAGPCVVPVVAQNKSEVALRAAIETETVKGDLTKAIEQYKKLAGEKDRAIASRALIRLAGVYQKQGDGEARKVYERVVKEFADQREAVAAARIQLGTPLTGGAKITRVVTEPLEAVSPDGRYFAFVDWKGTESGNLAIREVGSGRNWKITGLTDPNQEAGYMSAFSPDSKQIVYVWADWSNNHTELRISSVHDDPAKTPRVLAKIPNGTIEPMAWSPDGKWIAALIDVAGSEQLTLVSAADGSTRTIVEGSRLSNRVFFSPDSKYLAIDLPSGTNSLRDVYLFPVSGGSRIPIVQQSTDNVVMGWAQDGRLLYTQGGSVNTLWAVPVADGKTQGAAVSVHEGVGIPLGLTSQGALYYRIQAGGNQIFTATIDFNAEKVLTPRMFPLANGSSPEWSPDGKSLLYLDNGWVTLHSMDTGQVIAHRGCCIPRWTHDGKGFLYASSDAGIGAIRRVDAKTGQSIELMRTTKGQISMALPSRDGAKVYYWLRMTDAEKSHAYVERDLATGNEKELVRRPTLGRAAMSPDGKFLLVNANTNQGLLVPLDGSPVRELMRARDGQLLNVTTWGPDSRSVYLWTGTSQTHDELWNIPIAGGTPRKVDLAMDLDINGGVLMVSPDGKHVVYAAGRGPETREVRVLENFLPAK